MQGQPHGNARGEPSEHCQGSSYVSQLKSYVASAQTLLLHLNNPLQFSCAHALDASDRSNATSFRTTQDSPSLADIVVGVTAKAMLDLLDDGDAASAFPKVQAYVQRWGEKEALAAADVGEFTKASRHNLDDEACASEKRDSLRTNSPGTLEQRIVLDKFRTQCIAFGYMMSRLSTFPNHRKVGIDTAAPLHVAELIVNVMPVG